MVIKKCGFIFNYIPVPSKRSLAYMYGLLRAGGREGNISISFAWIQPLTCILSVSTALNKTRSKSSYGDNNFHGWAR